MRFPLLLCVFWLIQHSSFAVITHEYVAPGKLKHGPLTFSVLSAPVEGGVNFRITIEGTKEIPENGFSVGLGIIIDTETEFSSQSVNQQLAPVRKDDSVVVQFTVSNALVATPNLCFSFNEFAFAELDGKLLRMPSMHIYLIRLKDFM